MRTKNDRRPRRRPRRRSRALPPTPPTPPTLARSPPRRPGPMSAQAAPSRTARSTMPNAWQRRSPSRNETRSTRMAPRAHRWPWVQGARRRRTSVGASSRNERTGPPCDASPSVRPTPLMRRSAATIPARAEAVRSSSAAMGHDHGGAAASSRTSSNASGPSRGREAVLNGCIPASGAVSSTTLHAPR